MTRDEIRTAGLLFGEELALGLIEPETLRTAEVQRAVRGLPVPSALSRAYQRRQMRHGRLTYERHGLRPLMDARRAVLGDAAHGRPKLLVRVDAFPHMHVWEQTARFGTEAAATAHAILRDAAVPYLMAVTPRVSRLPLDPGVDEWREHDDGERALLAQLRRDGVSFAVHGLDHRTRRADPRKRSEFAGRKRKDVEERLDTAQATLRDEALHADVFVPPFDRFDASCWPALASRFDVVCGGPDSVSTMGFHRTPAWRGDAVWLPAYPPLHGTAAEVLDAVRALVEDGTGLWIPVVLRWGDELEDEWRALTELCALLGQGELARSWEDFLLAVRASRQLASTLER
ncbi:MAG: hypothetical protein JWN65_4176 [Solirubrobacterales bacterium]|nr:hypothetical protein [Solirubrobacterales bacterium]